MGCGISTLDAKDGSPSRRSNRSRHRIVAPPVKENNSCILPTKKDINNENGHEGVAASGNVKEVKPLGNVGSNNNEEKLREKCVEIKKLEVKEEGVYERLGKEEHDNEKNVKNNCFDDDEEEHEENIKHHDGSFIGMSSPSFRDYCIDSDSVDRSSVGDSKDFDSGESTKNCSDEDSINIKNKPTNKRSVNSNKVPDQKEERKGRRFRNVINKGKPKGKRNLLNFGCYNVSSDSYPESSFDKITGKAT